MERLEIILIVLVMLFIGTPAMAATCYYYENFDDGDLDQPVEFNGTIQPYTSEYCSTVPNCIATTPGQYIVSRPGYGGTGYCLSNPANPVDANKDPYIRLFCNGHYPARSFFSSYRMRIIGAWGTDYQNIKIIYPMWNNAYAMFNTSYVGSSELFYAARNNYGSYIDNSVWISYSGGDLNDGNWHKVSHFIDLDHGLVYLWINVETPTWENYTFKRDYDDSVWADGTLGTLSFTLGDQTDASGCCRARWEYKELDDLQLWDTIPDSEPPTPTCLTHPALCLNINECEGAGWHWCDEGCQAEECPQPPEPTCQTNPELCENNEQCLAAGWNWCGDTCQEEECPPEPPEPIPIYPQRSHGKSFHGTQKH